MEPNAPAYGDTEMALLKLHQNLIDFYSKHNQANVNEEVLTILMQFFIDSGGVALNRKLMQKYGEDLQTFKRVPNNHPLPEDVTDIRRTSATLERLNRQKENRDLEMMGFDRQRPEGKIETTATIESIRKSTPISPQNAGTSFNFNHRPKKKKNMDPELVAYKAEKNRELQENAAEVAGLLDEFFKDEPEEPEEESNEDPALQLFLLDDPKTVEISIRDRIEAFYSVHDEEKLDDEKAIRKFVKWVGDNTLEKLSNKLKAKYHKGLDDYKKLAIRRRNLENLLTTFYMKYDSPKLDSRWTILKILNWTMNNGVAALNKKFKTRYGHHVVNNTNAVEEDLDI